MSISNKSDCERRAKLRFLELYKYVGTATAKTKTDLLARSSPRSARSSFLRSTRSFDMYRLCVLVFHPGAGPADDPRTGVLC